MYSFFRKHRLFWTDGSIIKHMGLSVLLLSVSLCLTYVATKYLNAHTGEVVSDILLDNLPVLNVGYIFFQGAFLFLLVLVAIGIYEPAYIPFTIESTALFFLVRSIFMVMTHLSPPSIEYYNYVAHEHHVPEVLFSVSSGNDLFFSAHAGYPFLLAVIFWKVKYLRYFFLLCSLIGSVAVILGHLHYSIDVFSAYFIAFGVFEISRYFFRKEYVLLVGKEEVQILP